MSERRQRDGPTKVYPHSISTVSQSEEEAKRQVLKAAGLITVRPDYSVSSNELRLKPPGSVEKGREVTIAVPVRNLGAVRTHSVTVALLRAPPGGKGVELAPRVLWDPPLMEPVTVKFPWKAGAGTHQLRVVVDPDGEADDADKGNNTAMFTVEVPGDDKKPTLALKGIEEGASVSTPLVVYSGLTEHPFRCDPEFFVPFFVVSAPSNHETCPAPPRYILIFRFRGSQPVLHTPRG